MSPTGNCELCFTLAKVYEDIRNFEKAFEYLKEGNRLRKELLNYDIGQDERLFEHLYKIQPKIDAFKINNQNEIGELIPIFILGMPRSGTTLVEQIVSSHSAVKGAGELAYAAQYGVEILERDLEINSAKIETFRTAYLKSVHAISEGKRYVTDKMPQNFKFIPLICAAFPEAKIIHVKRDPKAVIWSNYRHYFQTVGLGYAYDLDDCISYYNLYETMMTAWCSIYRDQIFNLDYEKLTVDQYSETKKLIDHLGITWEDDVMSPQENDRSVITASNLQVRKKIYAGSSKAWRKYEPYLGNVFDRINKLEDN
jgi:hypothetical protein